MDCELCNDNFMYINDAYVTCDFYSKLYMVVDSLVGIFSIRNSYFWHDPRRILYWYLFVAHAVRINYD